MTTDSDKRSDRIVFILGLGSSLHINVGGYLAISEFLAVFLGTAALFRLYRRPGDAHAKTASSLGLLWLASALVADVWNGTTLDLMVKGLSKAALIVLQLALAYELLRSDLRRIRWYFVGVALSSLLSIYILKPGSIAAFEQLHGLVLTDSFEKQWIAVVIYSVLAAWFFTGSSYPSLSAMVVAIIGAFAIFSGSRSSGALLIVASFSVYVVKLSATVEGSRAEQRAIRQMLLVFALFALGALVFFGYSIAADTGRLGDRAAEKYTMQSGSQFGLLLGGRGDFLAGLLAVQGSPILGHGTWAADVEGYRFQAAHIIGMEYFQIEGSSGGRIGGHSNILEAWVEHGILAVPFWGYLFYFILKCFSNGIYYHFAFLGPLMFLLYGRAWDFFFSPINARTTLAFTFALFILVVLRAERLSGKTMPSMNGPPRRDRLGSRQGPSNLSI
jgi:hypothetical protein